MTRTAKKHHYETRPRRSRRRNQKQFQNVFSFAELELFQQQLHEPAKPNLLEQFANLTANPQQHRVSPEQSFDAFNR